MHLLTRLQHHAATRPDEPAFVDAGTGESICWKALRTAASAAAPAGAEDRIIRLPNGIQFVIRFLAALTAGRPAFLVSPEVPPAQVRALGLPDPARSRPGLMLLSSGSTAVPKVVFRSADSVDAVCRQMCEGLAITAADRVLATVPLCHSYGIEHGLLAPVWAGATTYLCRGINVPVLLQLLTDAGITLLPGVPPVFEMLARHRTSGHRLRAAYSAGAPLPASVVRQFRTSFEQGIGQVYGSTEIGSVTYAPPAATEQPGNVGHPLPGVEVTIDDGQVLVAAPSMFDGYVGHPPRTGRYFPTGDLGRLDPAGNLVLQGRAKLLIDVGGRKVNPVEVEDVFRRHPAVADCVVVPVRQSETVFRLKAIVVLRQSAIPPTPDDLRDFVRPILAGYQIPRLVELRDSLPRSPTGKVLRQLVKA